MNGFSERLKFLMENQSARKFASDIGVSETMVRKYLKGGMPGLDIASRICRAKGASIHWLATGEGQAYIDRESVGDNCASSLIETHPLEDEFALIDGYHVTIDEVCNDEEPQVRRRLAFRKKWLEYRGLNPQNLRVYFVKSYLEGGVISGGDSVMINMADTSIADGVFALKLNSNMLIRWLRLRVDGSVDVFTDINQPPDENVPSEQIDQIEIMGRVVWLGKDFK